MGVNRGPVETAEQRRARKKAAGAVRTRKARQRKALEDRGIDVPSALERGRASVSGIPDDDPEFNELMTTGRSLMAQAPGDELIKSNAVVSVYSLLGEETSKAPDEVDVARVKALATAFNSTASGLQKLQNIITSDQLYQVLELVRPDLKPETRDLLVKLLRNIDMTRGVI